MPKAAKKVAKKVVKPATVEGDPLAPVNAVLAQYSPEDQEKIEAIKTAGGKFLGTETSEELDAKVAALEESDEEEEERVEDDDCPDRVAPQYQDVVIDNKPRRFGIHFVRTVNGKSALYNELGQRISPVYTAEDVLPGSTDTNAVRSIAKAAAKNNSLRRNSMLPGDYLPGNVQG